MILVRTKLAPSPIHGIGCFAAEFIAKGTEVWRFTPGFDGEFPPDFPATLSGAARLQFLNYAYTSRASGKYILCADDTRFFNHSDTPNVINMPKKGEPEGVDIAARDIQPDEEILYDYRVFADPIPGENV